MLNQVIIANDRPKWVRAEDKRAVYQTRCSQFKKCSNLLGSDCKKMGGTEIPKLRR